MYHLMMLTVMLKSSLQRWQCQTHLEQKEPLICWFLLKEHEQVWKTQKESTASEPSALSHGHYKAAVFDPCLNEYDCLMRTIPLEFGFTPSQWLSITDIEILKKARVLGIDDMRLI